MGKLAAGFALQYPEVRLGVTTEDRPVDMVEEGYDLMIRVNPDPDQSLIGRSFLLDRLVAPASPALAAQQDGGAPVPVVVRAAGAPDAHWNLTPPQGSQRIAVDPVLRLSCSIMVRDAVRLGVGAAMLPVSLVSHDIAAGTLVHWGVVDGPEIALWALYPSRRLLSARVGLPRLPQNIVPERVAGRAGSAHRRLTATRPCTAHMRAAFRASPYTTLTCADCCKDAGRPRS